jgi:hypothetical protein
LRTVQKPVHLTIFKDITIAFNPLSTETTALQAASLSLVSIDFSHFSHPSISSNYHFQPQHPKMPQENTPSSTTSSGSSGTTTTAGQTSGNLQTSGAAAISQQLGTYYLYLNNGSGQNNSGQGK